MLSTTWSNCKTPQIRAVIPVSSPARCSVPISRKDTLAVNWFGVSISDAKGRAPYDSAFVTSLGVSPENVALITACTRARWKIENESFNILKNKGYHLEHNFLHPADTSQHFLIQIDALFSL
jgi:hypothetical protein